MATTIINGTNNNDVLKGGNGGDTLNGGAGNDVIMGGNGGDTIDGGTGSDTMLGGNGKDTFIETISENYLSFDKIDGGNGKDTIILRGTAHQLQLLSQAIADWQASNKSQVFHFGNYANGLLNLDIVNVESIQLVTIANTGPLAVNDTASVSESITPNAAVDLVGNVLTNDSDPDAGDVLTVTSLSPMVGTYGTLVIQANGSYSYSFNNATSEALAQGDIVLEIFTYTISDGQGGTATATLNITITGTNDAPVATTTTLAPFATTENASLNLTSALLANITDVDAHHTLSIASVSGDPHVKLIGGVVTFNPGTDFDHLAKGDTQTINFSYIAKDEFNAMTSPVNASIIVTGTNDAPVATLSTLAPLVVTENASSDLTSALLSNITDKDDHHSLGIASIIDNSPDPYIRLNGGIVTFDAHTDFDYLAQGETATVNFTYVAKDEFGAMTGPVNASVTITGVDNASIIAGDRGGFVKEDVTLSTSGVLEITDIDSPSPSFVAIPVAHGNYGDFTMDSAGNWTYTLNNTNTDVQGLMDGQTLADVFQVSSLNDSTVQNVTIMIGGTNEAGNAVAFISGDTAGAVVEDIMPTTSGNLMSSDADAGQSGFLNLSQVGKYGDFNIDSDGHWTYVVNDKAAEGQQYEETFTVHSVDNSASQDITISVTGANDAPVTLDADNAGYVVSGTDLAFLFSDIDEGDSLTYSLINAPNGLSIDLNTGVISADLPDGIPYAFLDGVSVQATDSQGAVSTPFPLLMVFDSAYSGGTLQGTNTTETLLQTAPNQVIIGHGGNDMITALTGNNLLMGDVGNDILVGGEGNDVFLPGSGMNNINGGGGSNIVSYANLLNGITINLTTGSATGVGVSDTLANIQTVIGTDFNDILIAGTGTQSLLGGAGSDTLTGGTNTIAVYAGDASSYSFVLSGGVVTQINKWNATHDTIIGTDTINGITKFKFGGLNGQIFDSFTTGAGAILVGASSTQNNIILGSASNNEIIGSAQSVTTTTPTASLSYGSNILYGAEGNITTLVGNVETVTTTAAVTNTTYGNNTIVALEGNELLYGNVVTSDIILSAGTSITNTSTTYGSNTITSFADPYVAGAVGTISVQASALTTNYNNNKMIFNNTTINMGTAQATVYGKAELISFESEPTASGTSATINNNALVFKNTTITTQDTTGITDQLVGHLGTLRMTLKGAAANSMNLAMDSNFLILYDTQITAGNGNDTLIGSIKNFEWNSLANNSTGGSLSIRGNIIAFGSNATTDAISGLATATAMRNYITVTNPSASVGFIDNPMGILKGNILTAGNGTNTLIGNIDNFNFTITGQQLVGGISPVSSLSKIGENRFIFGGNTLKAGTGNNLLIGNIQDININLTANSVTGVLGANPPDPTTQIANWAMTYGTNLLSASGGNNTLIGNIQNYIFSATGGSSSEPDPVATGTYVNRASFGNGTGNRSTYASNTLTAGDGNDTLIGNIQNFQWTGNGGTATTTQSNTFNISTVSFNAQNHTFGGNSLNAGKGNNTVIGSIQNMSFNLTGGTANVSAGITNAGAQARAEYNGMVATFGGNTLNSGIGNDTLVGDIDTLNIKLTSGTSTNGGLAFAQFAINTMTFGGNSITDVGGINTLIGSIKSFNIDLGSNGNFFRNTFTFGPNTLLEGGANTNTTMYGTMQSFTLTGTLGANGSTGNQNVLTFGNNTLIAGLGTVTMYATTGWDATTLASLAAFDVLNTINGGIHDLRVGSGLNTLYGGSYGTSYADFRNESVGVSINLSMNGVLQAGHVILNSMQGLIGSQYNDTLTVGAVAGQTYLKGSEGNDILTGTTAGGSANTTAVYVGKISDYIITVGATGITQVQDTITGTGRDGTDTLSGITRLQFGGTFGPEKMLVGTTGNNSLSAVGLTGNSFLMGMGGNDTLTGSVVTNAHTFAIFRGNKSDYTFTFNPNGTVHTVTDTVAGRDGVDTLTNISDLQFAGGKSYHVENSQFRATYISSGENGTMVGFSLNQVYHMDPVIFMAHGGLNDILVGDLHVSYTINNTVTKFWDDNVGESKVLEGQTYNNPGNWDTIRISVAGGFSDYRPTIRIPGIPDILPAGLVEYGSSFDSGDDNYTAFIQVAGRDFSVDVHNNNYNYEGSLIVGGDGDYTLSGTARVFGVGAIGGSGIGGVDFAFPIDTPGPDPFLIYDDRALFHDNNFHFYGNELFAAAGTHTLIGAVESWTIGVGVNYTHSTLLYQLTGIQGYFRPGYNFSLPAGDKDHPGYFYDNSFTFDGNILHGGTGNDTLIGDIKMFTFSNESLDVSAFFASRGLIKNSLYAQADHNSISFGDNFLDGGAGNDTLYGVSPHMDDYLGFLQAIQPNYWVPSNNTLTLGNNILKGGVGNDIIWGYGENLQTLLATNASQVTIGTNTFVFNLGADDGDDKVMDFNSTRDILEFQNVAHVGSNTAVQDVNLKIASFINDGGNHLQVNFTTGGSIIFNDFAFSNLTATQVANHDILSVVNNASQIHAIIV